MMVAGPRFSFYYVERYMDLCKKTKEYPEWIAKTTVQHLTFVDSIYRLAYQKLDEGGSYLLETPPQRLVRRFYDHATVEEVDTLSEVRACIEQFGQDRHTNNSPLGVFVLMYNVMNGLADRLHILLIQRMRPRLGESVLRKDGTLNKETRAVLERTVAPELRLCRPFYAIDGMLPEAPYYRCGFRASPRGNKLYACLQVNFAVTRVDTYNGSQTRDVLLADIENGIVSNVHLWSANSRRTDWTENEVLRLKAQTKQMRIDYERIRGLADEFPDY